MAEKSRREDGSCQADDAIGELAKLTASMQSRVPSAIGGGDGDPHHPPERAGYEQRTWHLPRHTRRFITRIRGRPLDILHCMVAVLRERHSYPNDDRNSSISPAPIDRTTAVTTILVNVVPHLPLGVLCPNQPRCVRWFISTPTWLVSMICPSRDVYTLEDSWFACPLHSLASRRSF